MNIMFILTDGEWILHVSDRWNELVGLALVRGVDLSSSRVRIRSRSVELSIWTSGGLLDLLSLVHSVSQVPSHVVVVGRCSLSLLLVLVDVLASWLLTGAVRVLLLVVLHVVSLFSYYCNVGYN